MCVLADSCLVAPQGPPQPTQRKEEESSVFVINNSLVRVRQAFSFTNLITSAVRLVSFQVARAIAFVYV